MVREAVGDDAVRVACRRVGVDAEPRGELVREVVAGAHPHVDAGRAPGEPLQRKPRVIQRLPGHLEEDALLRIHGRGLLRGDPEEVQIEPVNPLNESAPPRAHLPWGIGIRVVHGVDVPSILWHFGDRIDAAGEQPPEGLRAVRASRKPAAHPDDGDGLHPRALDLVEPRLHLVHREQGALERR
jgi:hypothetical protein